MKNSKSFIKLVLVMLGGAVIGLLGAVISMFFGKNMIETAAVIGRGLNRVGAFAEVFLIIVFAAVAIGIYIYIRTLWKLEQESEDEMADLYGEKFEHWVQVGITLVECAIIVILIFTIMLLPAGNRIETDYEFIRTIMLLGAMVLGAAVMAVMEILFYQLMQKRDPQKKGDPSSFSFNKKWLEGCDETEKLVIYHAGYKAFAGIQVVLGISVIIAIMGKMQFGTGNFPIVILGTVWITGTVIFNMWKLKGLETER